MMRGSLNPAWCWAYSHIIGHGASTDDVSPPHKVLNRAAKWLETKEPVWRERRDLVPTWNEVAHPTRCSRRKFTELPTTAWPRSIESVTSQQMSVRNTK
ncbi:hypothetical protein LY78DRAFT_728078, partial [Colletotrichum sublineola]